MQIHDEEGAMLEIRSAVNPILLQMELQLSFQAGFWIYFDVLRFISMCFHKIDAWKFQQLTFSYI